MSSYFSGEPCFTGQAPPNLKHEFIATPKNNWELVEQYYINPLRTMKNHEAFICLSICFALYEKLLRKTEGLGDDETFSQGHPVFEVMGEEWGISSENAYRTWAHWRNGLLHRGMPKASGAFSTWLTPEGSEAITVDAQSHISINPWLFRNRILALLEKKKQIWKDVDFPLLMEIKKAT